MSIGDPPISLTDAAVRQLKSAAADPVRAVLRIAVEGGGCSGFSYSFRFGPAPEKGDILVERDGARVALDPAGIPFLAGSSLDYTEELIGAAFRISNPNAVAACGCGVSFSIS